MTKYRKKTAAFMLTASLAAGLCISGAAAQKGYAAVETDKAGIEEALNLANINPEWTYSEEADAWTMAVVTAVTNAELPDLALGIGCELYLSPEYMADCLECLRLGSVLTLNGTEYVLVEFSQRGVPFESIKECVFRLKEAGWIPVIAHAERYGKSYRNIEDVRWLKEQGCKLQVNIYSLAADVDKERRDLTRQMVKEKLVDFLGTDAHRMNHRPPRIARGVEVLREIADLEYMKQIAYQNAKDILKLQ